VSRGVDVTPMQNAQVHPAQAQKFIPVDSPV